MKYISILIVALFVLGCTDDEPDSTNNFTDEWHLESAVGGIVGANDTYDRGDVTWDFFLEDSVAIINNDSGSNVYPGPITGVYSYEKIENSRGVFLVVDNFEWGNFTIDGRRMTIDSGRLSIGDATDGIAWIFVR